jgi:hypothetical protein
MQIIKLKEKHLREIIVLREESNEKALRVFKETNDIHLANLNNTYARAKATIEEIVLKTVSMDEHKGFLAMTERRFMEIEKKHSEDKGATRIIDKKESGREKLIYFVIGFVSSVIITIINSYL